MTTTYLVLDEKEKEKESCFITAEKGRSSERLRVKERKRKSVLQSARADGDGMRRPPGHLITRAGREEVMRKEGGEEVRKG